MTNVLKAHKEVRKNSFKIYYYCGIFLRSGAGRYTIPRLK